MCDGGQIRKAIAKLPDQGNNADLNGSVQLLREYTKLKALSKGRKVHAYIIKHRTTLRIFHVNTVINMYIKCGSLLEANVLFDLMPKRNVFTWTTMISGYAQYGTYKSAVKLLMQMQEEGYEPNEVTYASALNSCVYYQTLEWGKHIHAHLIKARLETDVFVGSILIDMYAKYGNTSDACRVFDMIAMHDIVLWNVMISVYAKVGSAESMKLFCQMQQLGFKPNKVTYLAVLDACCNAVSLAFGKVIHVHILNHKFDSDIFVGTSLIDMYFECESIVSAYELFDMMPARNIVSWTTMISGHARHGLYREAIICFRHMQQDGLKPNKVTYLTVLTAFANVGALAWAKHVHSQLLKTELESDTFMGNNLIVMYGHCGSMECAQQVFDHMFTRDSISWNAIITGYADHGQREALKLLSEMQLQGSTPDQITHIAILNACSHMGLVDEGHHHFVCMHEHGRTNMLEEHYACAIDLLGRAGCLLEARDCIGSMPLPPDSAVWRAFLGACISRSNKELAEHAITEISSLDLYDIAGFTLISNVYAIE